MSAQKKSEIDSVAGHVASKFPRLSRRQATIVFIVALIVGGVGYTMYQVTRGNNDRPPVRVGDRPTSGGSSVSIVGSVSGGANVAGRDVNIVNPLPKRTSSDLRVTSVNRRRGGVFVAVANAGPEPVEAVKGTITAQVIPEHPQNVNGTPLGLIPSQPNIAPGATVEFSARCSDSSIWYVTGIKVWSDKNDDPNVRNSDYQFSRASPMFVIEGMNKGSRSWTAAQLDRLRSN